MQDDSVKTSGANRVRRFVFGAPRNVNDPKIFHKIALIPILAWIGLGADGFASPKHHARPK